MMLFDEAKVGNLVLNNRFVMAPMTRSFAPNGVPGQVNADYYRRRVHGGVGLIITEGAIIDHPSSSSSSLFPRFHGADALAGWKLIVEEVHKAGGRIVPQLWHVGPHRSIENAPNAGQPPASASGLRLPGNTIGTPMSDRELTAVVGAYADAAAEAKGLGFDGIEIHGAHGYLIDNFFWKDTNRRVDHYGGDWKGRTRLAADVVRECRRRVGPDFPIILRFSQWKLGAYDAKLCPTPHDLETFLFYLTDAGVDLFHASTRRYWEPAFEDGGRCLSEWTKALSGRPTIAVGSVGLARQLDVTTQGMVDVSQLSDVDGDVRRLERLLVSGAFDLIAVGRALIANPDWVNKVRDGQTDSLIQYSPESIRTSHYRGPNSLTLI